MNSILQLIAIIANNLNEQLFIGYKSIMSEKNRIVLSFVYLRGSQICGKSVQQSRFAGSQQLESQWQFPTRQPRVVVQQSSKVAVHEPV